MPSKARLDNATDALSSRRRRARYDLISSVKALDGR
jgi:hypothetical protein